MHNAAALCAITSQLCVGLLGWDLLRFRGGQFGGLVRQDLPVPLLCLRVGESRALRARLHLVNLSPSVVLVPRKPDGDGDPPGGKPASRHPKANAEQGSSRVTTQDQGTIRIENTNECAKTAGGAPAGIAGDASGRAVRPCFESAQERAQPAAATPLWHATHGPSTCMRDLPFPGAQSSAQEGTHKAGHGTWKQASLSSSPVCLASVSNPTTDQTTPHRRRIPGLTSWTRTVTRWTR